MRGNRKERNGGGVDFWYFGPRRSESRGAKKLRKRERGEESEGESGEGDRQCAHPIHPPLCFRCQHAALKRETQTKLSPLVRTGSTKTKERKIYGGGGCERKAGETDLNGNVCELTMGSNRETGVCEHPCVACGRTGYEVSQEGRRVRRCATSGGRQKRGGVVRTNTIGAEVSRVEGIPIWNNA